MRVRWLGRMEFEACWSLQEAALREIVENPGADREVVYLVEHPHVFTLGRRGESSNILSQTGPRGEAIPVIRINRGGDVTYHGPGQLVGYPILDLNRRGRDVHHYLRQLEAILIRVAGRLGIEAFRRDQLTGVWTERGKLASIGVGVKRWVTQHGFALNVCPDLDYFGLIHPCGLRDCQVVSFASLLGRKITLGELLPWVESELRAEFASEEAGSEPASSSLSVHEV